MFYKRSLDQLREEYDQYRIDNDPVSMQRQVGDIFSLLEIRLLNQSSA